MVMNDMLSKTRQNFEVSQQNLAMFFQPPEKEPGVSEKSTESLKSARRKRKKRAQKFKNKKQALKKEKQRFANTMSSWAANFTMAATWQLKHQVAHWKSRAKTLEYENNMLRTMLRQYYIKGKGSQHNERMEEMSLESNTEEDEDTEEDETEDVEESNDEDEDKIEVSEEFVDFLKDNIEYRKMRQERARLRQLEEEMPMMKMESCPEPPPDIEEEYEKLYGAQWQRIAALEMSMESQFISDCDKDKPALWPILPLRM